MGSSISTDGSLYLENNEIEGDENSIANYNGKIISELNVVVLDNTTHTFAEEGRLYAILTDDNGNVVRDKKLKFYIESLGKEYASSYDVDSGLHYCDINITQIGTYTVTVSSENANLNITNGTIVIIEKGSFTDLQYKINNAEDKHLVLTYDFAFNESFDSALINGIVISKNIIIDGNGSVISGSDLARVFNLTADLILSNVTISNAKAEKGAAIYVNEGVSFEANAADFIDNTAEKRGAAIYSEGPINVSNSKFDGNDYLPC